MKKIGFYAAKPCSGAVRTSPFAGFLIFTAMEKNKIISKPTVYNGYHFRSRTEARWAVFFDTLGIKYYYEHEDFILPNGERYLPDFYLPEYDGGGGVFVEVKGTDFKDEEKIKCAELCLLTKREVIMLDGPPDKKLYNIVHYTDSVCYGCTPTYNKCGTAIHSNDCTAFTKGNIIERPDCTIFFAPGMPFYLDSDRGKSFFRCWVQEYEYMDLDYIEAAVNAARSAQFEFKTS